jgi:hypothetical protein
MFAKKFWIPIILVLIGVAIGGTFFRQHIASQEPTTTINPVTAEPVEVERAGPKPPPPGETTETGHWHGDQWHAEPHEIAETPLPKSKWQSGDVWYPDNYTQTDIEKDLAKKPASTDEEYHRRALKHQVNFNLRKHREKYPDCTEHEAVLTDAIRFAEWVLADQAFMDKYSELTDEFTRLTDEVVLLFEKYNYRPAYEATHIPEAERLKDTNRIRVINAQLDDHSRRRDALNRETPIYPKPLHTH